MITLELFPFIITPLGVWHVAKDPSFEPLSCVVAGADPMERARLLVQEQLGLAPALVHSTSWRYDGDDTLILTFAAVLPRGANVGDLRAQPCVSGRALVYGGPLAAPVGIRSEQVRDHALRHLAFLAQTDPAVQQILTPISGVLAWEPDVARFFLCEHRMAA